MYHETIRMHHAGNLLWSWPIVAPLPFRVTSVRHWGSPYTMGHAEPFGTSRYESNPPRSPTTGTTPPSSKHILPVKDGPPSKSLEKWGPYPFLWIFFQLRNFIPSVQWEKTYQNAVKPAAHKTRGGGLASAKCFLRIYLSFLMLGSLKIQKIIKFRVDWYNTSAGHTKLSTTNRILMRRRGGVYDK